MSNPFNDLVLTDWLLDLLRPSGIAGPEYWDIIGLRVDAPIEVAVEGEGPYPDGEFREFLRSQGHTLTRIPDPHVSAVVIGTEGWSTTIIDRQTVYRRDAQLKVYSQELFVVHMLTQIDPFEAAERDTLERFGRDHPALRYLMERGFDWPSTVPSGGGPPKEQFGLSNGMLSYLGYHVGMKGASRQERRAILRTVIEERLPRPRHLFPDSYVQEWGDPGTQVRLRKTASSIATFCRDCKKRWSPSYEQAIEDWEADLAWLQDEYHDGGWIWPMT